MKLKTGPKLKVDLNDPKIRADFERLCQIHCTLIEISEWFGVSEDTIERACERFYKEKFADVFKKKSSKGKISLRRTMFQKALEGNVVMMIFLSKQVLGFKDKVETSEDAKSAITLKYNFRSRKSVDVDSEPDPV